MTRSQRLKTIVKLNGHKERHAARQFASSQTTLNTVKQRLQQMLGYREEYLQLFKPGQQTCSVQSLREQQAFILQLDKGIRVLREQIRIQEHMNEQERQNWLRQKQQLDTMQNIHDRCRFAERQLSELRAQHSLDELAINNAVKLR